MTKQEAKDLSIELWQYLADHSEIDDKSKIEAKDLRERVCCYINYCPLCGLFYDDKLVRLQCNKCPLDSCFDYGSDFKKWRNAVDNETRKAAAESILAKIRAWDVNRGTNDDQRN